MAWSKNKLIVFVIAVLLIVVLNSCEDNSINIEIEDYLIVEAYLYPGLPVNNIRVFKQNSFTDLINDNKVISGLQINLKVDSQNYLLSEKQDSLGYYFYAEDDLVLIPGSFCEMEFEYNDIIISSETTIPGKPENLELSKTSISVSIGGWGGSGIEPIEVTWSNPDNDYYYMVAMNIEENPVPINDEMEDQPLSIGTSPATTNLLNIVPRQLRYYGTYQLVLFRVNPEFAELSLFTTTNTINLSEPYTNIINGKGIFTAFASDTAYFEAVSK